MAFDEEFDNTAISNTYKSKFFRNFTLIPYRQGGS